MKTYTLMLALVLGSGALKADDTPKPLSFQLEEKKLYYSALNEFFKETYNITVTKDDVERLEGILFYTGIELLEDYDPSLLNRYPSSSTRFILGRAEMKGKRYKKALEYFDKIHPDHRYYPEGMLLKAQVHELMGDSRLSFAAYDKCLDTAEKQEGRAANEKVQRYYRMAFEICLVNKARHHFKVGEYQNSIDAYNKIPKVSYKWPYLLLEKAWVYYAMGDYNRVLGLLVTYKSPLLDTYFFPEAEYLASLAYFRLCLYEDSMVIINQYYQFYRPRFTALEAVLRKNVNSQKYFYDLMFKPGGEELAGQGEFVKQIVTRLKKQIRFSLDFNAIHKISQEMKRLSSEEKDVKLRNKLLAHLGEVQGNLVAKINYNAKTDIFQFLKQVPFLSSELFKLNLEILSRKKDLVYSNRKLVSDRSRGDFDNVKRSKFEYFWKFNGSFWADELGDYSLGLKSNCQTLRKESSEEEK